MQQMMAAGQHDLERFLTDIYRVISSTANPLKDKVSLGCKDFVDLLQSKGSHAGHAPSVERTCGAYTFCGSN